MRAPVIEVAAPLAKAVARDLNPSMFGMEKRSQHGEHARLAYENTSSAVRALARRAPNLLSWPGMSPRLREDLVTASADEQGVACIEVTDPLTAVGFRFYDFEYALARQLTGQPLESVVAWASETYGIDLSPEALDQFIEKLAGLGFLVAEAPARGRAELAGNFSDGRLSPIPESTREILPGLQLLAGPLPPLLAAGQGGDKLASGQLEIDVFETEQQPAAEVNRSIEVPRSAEAHRGTTSNTETPLGSMADVIAAHSLGPAPVGALDVGMATAAGGQDRAPVTGQSREGKTGMAGSAATTRGPSSGTERRQPPRPEVVVMPPVAELALPPKSRGRSPAWLLLLGLAVAAAVAVWFLRAPEPSPSPSPSSLASTSAAPIVHVVSPQPTTFYRWFDSVGTVAPGRDENLSFSVGGRLHDAMPPGTTFSAGEAIARLVGVTTRELAVNQLRGRVAYLEQLRDSSRADRAENAARQAEQKLAQKKQELAAAEAALAAMEIRPKMAGDIAEILVPKAAIIRPGTPVFRIHAAGPRATFSLPPGDVARARALGFCRVETIPRGGDPGAVAASPGSGGQAIDCAFAPEGGKGETRISADLLGSSAVAPGTAVRLASARYDGVFPVPRTAIAHEGGADRLWIVAAGERTESRAVQVAATVNDVSLVARGVAVGDVVIIDPPAQLRNDIEVSVAR